MDFFTPGNILAVAISFALVLLFRQLDKNNRSLEKIKKFGDKLKDELDAFVKTRVSALEESAISLEVQQTKAVAAVNRLETIRDDLARREADLLERTKAVETFGRQIEQYDATIRQLMEMTSLAETNLSKIRVESDFADSLAKKLLASKKQLEDIEATIPALESHFADMNRSSLSKIHSDVLAATAESVNSLEKRVLKAGEEGETLLAKTTERLKELYQKALTEAARRADALEDAAFAKLKEQAGERLSKYKQAAEERTAVLQEQIKERLHELQGQIKTFHSSWRTEADEYLEATRAEVRELDAKTALDISSVEERVRSAQNLAESRTAELESSYRSLEQTLEHSFAGLSDRITRDFNAFETRLGSEFTAARDAADTSLSELAGSLDARMAELDERSTARLDELGGRVDGALAAAARAAADEAARLKREFGVRVDELEKSSASLLAETSERGEDSVRALSESLARDLESARGTLASRIAEVSERLGQSLAAVTRSADTGIESVTGRLESLDREINDNIAGLSSKTDGEISRIDARLGGFAAETESRLAKFDGLIGDAERLDAALRSALRETEGRVTGGFERYASEQEIRQQEFERRLGAASDTLATRMQELENGLNELKSRAYDNVSERLKLFEDDFFADLAKRSDEIGTALERWKEDVDSRLSELAGSTESAREELENAYSAELKERLSSITEQYRGQTARLEDQIATVENALRARITASDQSILEFANQLRADFASTREAAEAAAQNEFKSHRLGIQELLRKQEQEIENRTREFTETIANSRSEADTQLASIRSEFASWQQKNALQLEDARARLDERVTELHESASASIVDIETVWQTKFRDWQTKADIERQRLSDSLSSLDQAIAAANEDFDRRSREALAGFTRSYEAMTAETSRRIRETGAETDEQIRTITGSVQDIREQVELTRERLMQKLQSETGNLGQTLEEIDKKQKAFIAQTRVFDRAEELRQSLDSGIESLKGELSRLDVYRQTMSTLEGQYQKVRKLEEESSQKMAKFLAEKKRIDILESDFTKLLGLSDSIDKKLSEFTTTNDDLQQWQVQIRRFEDAVTEVNGRYERLEKKSAVLDQTVTGVDKAFENLKSLESALIGYRKEMTSVPGELEAARKTMDTLLGHKDRTENLLDKLEALDDVLSDVETRTEKMQTAREWLARTETRLEEISKQSQDQLKLLGAIMKEDGPINKTKGAPALGIRENVIKLAHQGWKVDEISRVFQLSRGEVELILELPQK